MSCLFNEANRLNDDNKEIVLLRSTSEELRSVFICRLGCASPRTHDEAGDVRMRQEAE